MSDLYKPGTLLHMREIDNGAEYERPTGNHGGLTNKFDFDGMTPDSLKTPWLVVAAVPGEEPRGERWNGAYELFVVDINGNLGWVRQVWCEPL